VVSQWSEGGAVKMDMLFTLKILSIYKYLLLELIAERVEANHVTLLMPA